MEIFSRHEGERFLQRVEDTVELLAPLRVTPQDDVVMGVIGHEKVVAAGSVVKLCTEQRHLTKHFHGW